MGNDTWKTPLDLFEDSTQKQSYFKAAILSRVHVWGGRDETQQVEKGNKEVSAQKASTRNLWICCFAWQVETEFVQSKMTSLRWINLNIIQKDSYCLVVIYCHASVFVRCRNKCNLKQLERERIAQREHWGRTSLEPEGHRVHPHNRQYFVHPVERL